MRLLILSLMSLQLALQPPGHFEGSVVAEWNEDGLTMTLTKRFVYVDGLRWRWVAPAGSVVDGASIPQEAWTFIGGPFEGKYRAASVLHDVACVTREMPWPAVHKMFFYAMRDFGVPIVRAKIMHAAVYHFGPRWPYEEDICRSARVSCKVAEYRTVVPRPRSLDPQDFERVRQVIEETDGTSRQLSLEDIEKLTPSQLKQSPKP